MSHKLKNPILIVVCFFALSCDETTNTIPAQTQQNVPQPEIPVKDTSLSFTSLGRNYRITFRQSPTAGRLAALLSEAGDTGHYCSWLLAHSKFDRFENLDSSRFLISVYTPPAGSGFQGMHYIMNHAKTTLIPLCTYEENSSVFISKKKNKLLVLQSPQISDAANHEAHFGPRIQEATLYTLSGELITAESMGKTKHKYDPENEKNLSNLFKELNIDPRDFGL